MPSCTLMKRTLLASAALSILVSQVGFPEYASANAIVDISAQPGAELSLGDRTYLHYVRMRLNQDPGNSQEIVQQAKQTRPDLALEIEEMFAELSRPGATTDISSGATPENPEQEADGGETAEGSGSTNGLVLGGLAAVGSAAGIVALAGGGGGSGGSDKGDGGGKWKNPDPPPPPEYGDRPADFETAEYRQNSSLGQINASSAYARQFSGEGVVLAVMDTGIDLGHSEFKNRIVDPYNAHFDNQDVTDRDGHGTHVAGIVGAARDGKGMHGVAWSSRILPISFADKNGSLWSGEGSATIERGWNHAARHGAKAINNSWSFGNKWMDNTDKDEVERLMPRLVDAARGLVEQDVITVFTTGNDRHDQPSVLAGLPAYFPELEGRWIAVGAVDSANRLSSYSNACGDAAAWCMVAPGDNIISTVPGDYASMSGTSMAAPHVTGAIGVLYQAFPYLKGDEIVQILFETADDIGPAEKFGHGLLNLERATRPVGETRIPVGTDIAGGAEKLSGTSLQVSAVFGDGIEQALAGKTVMALDSFNRGYDIELGQMATRSRRDSGKSALHRLKLFGGLEERSINTISNGPLSITTATRLKADDTSLGLTPYSSMTFGFTSGGMSMEASLNPDAGRNFGMREMGFGAAPLVDGDSFDQPHLALMESGYGSNLGLALSDVSSLRLGVVTGNVAREDRSLFANTPTMYGAVGELSSRVWDGLSLKAALGAVSEEGSMLGSVSRGAFGEDLRSNTMFANLGAVAEITSDTRLTFTASLGRTSFKQNAGIIQGGENLMTTSFGVGVSHEGLFQKSDSLTLAASQPLRVEAGRIDLSVPTSRRMDGGIGYSNVSLSPQPSGREIDLQASYGFDLMEGVAASVGAMHRFDADHVKGRNETIGMMSVSFSF